MAEMDAQEQAIAAAWTKHRGGQQDAAINEFNAVHSADMKNIDALYGLGLAQRAAGNFPDSRDAFTRCLALINGKLHENPGDDTLEMLQRMTQQRLAEAR
jgi:hypothetical protein